MNMRTAQVFMWLCTILMTINSDYGKHDYGKIFKIKNFIISYGNDTYYSDVFHMWSNMYEALCGVKYADERDEGA